MRCPSDDSSPRPNGSTCGFSSQCESGICGGGTCLDPAVDTDQDQLLNGVEAALGTDPTRTDSDGDGKSDFDEVGDINAPHNDDGDNLPNAAESSVLDEDSDCIPDERDPQNSKFQGDLATVAEQACCCAGLCSEQEGLRGITVTAECIPGGGLVSGNPSEGDRDSEPAPKGSTGTSPGNQQPPVLRCTASGETDVTLAPCGGTDMVGEVPQDPGGGEF